METDKSDEEPVAIFLFSGKRKSGKDHICRILYSIFEDGLCGVLRISEPLKAEYAKAHHLNLRKLLGDGPYKEKYREKMIEWSDQIREKDPGYFCRAACESAKRKPLWIVSDIRRKTDIKWFKETYGEKVQLIRITASDSVRASRGWIFTHGVDDVKSECDLDDFEGWDLLIQNNDENDLRTAVNSVSELANKFLAL